MYRKKIMEKNSVQVQVKNISQSPQKMRLVIDVIRGMDVPKAIATLKYLNKRGSLVVSKAVESAAASALERFNLEPGSLKVNEAFVNEAPTRKTGRFASRGRFSRILKRRSHLNLTIVEK